MIFKNAFFATMIFATLMLPIGEELPANTIADMEFVKNFTHPDFQAKIFTPQKCVICDSFFGN